MTQQPDEGWVDCFHAGLLKYVTETLGRDVRIWRDKTKIEANSKLNPAIYETLPKCLLFIPILSPNFMTSKWCPKELEFFCEQNPEDSEDRIFPVSKIPIQIPPEVLQDNFLKYEFVKRNKFGSLAHYLDPSFGGTFETEFYLKVSDLSREIAKFILDYEAAHGELSKESPPPDEEQPLIYLAEPSPDLWDQYNEIKRDLEQREIKFIPENLNPLTKKPRFRKDYEEQVLMDMKKCRLAVHLIGQENNLYPAEGKPSYLHLQTDVVKKYSAGMQCDPAFKSLIWFPKDINSDDREHQTFIGNIRQNVSGKIEFLQNSIEEFKTTIQDGLKPPPPPIPETKPEDPTWVYIVYHKRDLDTALEVEEFLDKNGYAILPARDYLESDIKDDVEKMEREHYKYLTKCHGVVIYWNSADMLWVRNSILELESIKASRNRSFRANAVFCDGDLEDTRKAKFRPPFSNLFKVTYPPLNSLLKEKKDYPPLNKAFIDKGYSEFPEFLSRLGGQE